MANEWLKILKTSRYLQAWLVAIAIFVGLNCLLFNSPNYRLFSFAFIANTGMLLVFLLLSLVPIFKKKIGLAILIIVPTLGFSLCYIFMMAMALMFTPFDLYEYDFHPTLKADASQALPPPATIMHSPKFPDFELYSTVKKGEYLYQVFLTMPMQGKIYLKPFPASFSGSEPNVDIQQSTLLDVANSTQTITFENQQIYTFAQTKPFIMYDTSRWADYEVCVDLMFVPDDKTLPEKKLADKCFNVQASQK